MAKPGVVYEPLAKVRKELKVRWIRPVIDRERLQELNRRSDLQGWYQAGGHLAIWIATGALTYYFWAQSMWLAFLVALFFHGTVASFFTGIAPHELGHGTVFKTKQLNTFFLYIVSVIGWWNHFDYAASHTYHHRYTLHPEGDRENLLPISPLVGPFFLVQLFTINTFTQPGRTFGKGGFISTIYVTVLGALGLFGNIKIPHHEWLRALHEDQPEMRKDAIWWNRFMLMFHGAIVLASLLTGYWVFIFIITLSPFIGNWGVYALGMTQHTGLKENDNDFRKATRSVKVNPLAEFLYWRMNWHAEHHMFAGIPCYNLKKLYYEIADQMPEPRTLVGAWQEMRETWFKQEEDPDYYFDTPVPPVKTRQGGRPRAVEEIENSIGDLAPEGME